MNLLITAGLLALYGWAIWGIARGYERERARKEVQKQALLQAIRIVRRVHSAILAAIESGENVRSVAADSDAEAIETLIEGLDRSEGGEG